MKTTNYWKTIAIIFSLNVGLNPVYSIGLPGNGGTSGDDGSPTRVHQQNRSDFIKDCEKLAQTFAGSDQNWHAVLSRNTDYVDAANLIASDLSEEGDAKTRLADEACKGATTDDEKKQKISEFAAAIALCEAYRVSTNIDNYSQKHEDTFQGGSDEDSSPAGNMLGCMNQADPAAKQQCMAQAQSGPQLSCTHEGPETHDYLACKKIMNFVTGFALGKQAMQIQQGFRQNSHDMDNQEDFLQKQRNGEANLITDSMALQRDSLQKQGNLAYEMAAFDGAKAATLLSMIASFPRSEQMESQCVSELSSGSQGATSSKLDNVMLKAVEAGIAACDLTQSSETEPSENTEPTEGTLSGSIVETAKGILTNSGDSPTEGVCSMAVNQNNHFFKNHEAMDALKQQAMQAGLEAMANAAKGALAHKQAGYIDDAIEDVEEFEPPEFPVAEVPESTVSECLVDPEAEGCVAPPTPGSEGFRGQDFSATFGGSANLGDLGAARTGSDDDLDGSGSASTNGSVLPENFGSIQGTSVTDNSFADGTARAGSIKTGQAAAGGGGGGGGGAASLGGGGGGGRGPASKKAASGAKNVKVKTRGSGLGGFGGGRGALSRKKKKSSNPFAKLLGKNKKNGNKTLNFRGPAQIGQKKGSLFQMISNRYGDVQQKKRLLKYEKKN